MTVLVSGGITDAGALAAALLAVFSVLGLAVRYLLLPYLRDQLVRPVQETHRQVTSHDPPAAGDGPTVRDQLDQLQEQVAELTGKVRTTRRLAVAAGNAADGVAGQLRDHEAWAREEDSRLWTALQRHVRTAHKGHDMPETPAVRKGSQ